MRARQLTLDDVYFNLKPWPLTKCDTAVNLNAGITRFTFIHYRGWLYGPPEYIQDNLGLQVAHYVKLRVLKNLQEKLNKHVTLVSRFLCEQ